MPGSMALYESSVGAEHRRSLGQYWTAPKVAAFMVNWVSESSNGGIHDPAYGLGAFADALPRQSPIPFTASEIDPAVVDFARLHSRVDVRIAVEDYLLSWGMQFDNIVCNPPYMRFQNFRNRGEVLGEFKRHLGIRLSGYTNIASAFLMKSLAELRRGGRLAYVMPLEFLNAGYGSIVKAQLLSSRHLASLIRLECEKEAFPEVTTSVGIILYDAARRHSKVDFYNCKKVDTLSGILASPPHRSVPTETLDPSSKWLHHFKHVSVAVREDGMVPIGHYGRFSRGIATGANEFFALKPAQARELGMSGSDYKPCITKSAHVRRPIFDSPDFTELMLEDRASFLFSPDDRPSDAARRYIEQGEQKEFDQRYLTASRRPWFKTERRVPAPILVGVFSRGGYKVVLNRAGVLNLTCFHGFQPNALGRRYVERIFLYLMSSAGRDIASLASRQYGDALAKFEPNDLNVALAPGPEWFDSLSALDVEDAIRHVQKEAELPARIESRFASLVVSEGARAHTQIETPKSLF